MTPLEKTKQEIDALQKEIQLVKAKRDEAERDLIKAIQEETPADIRADFRALLDSATQELTRLGQEKIKLIEQRTALIVNPQGIVIYVNGRG